jgi:hypothetical protein
MKDFCKNVLNSERTIDNLEMLSGYTASKNEELTTFDGNKFYWINNFGGRPKIDYLEWTVESNLSESTEYYAWLHVKAEQATNFELTVTQESKTTKIGFVKAVHGWEVADTGILSIPMGVSKIKLTMASDIPQNCEIKGLDIIRKSDKQIYLDRITAYRKLGSITVNKLNDIPYGLFFQYGVWGYPQHGDKKNMDDSTNEFDINKFVDLLKQTGTQSVIWSLTWWEFKMQMNVKAVNDIVSNNSLTTTRNLVIEIAEACKKEGISFFMYYHHGIQQEPLWTSKQNCPIDLTQTRMDSRAIFFDNWKRVISEIGTTLGTNLDGWLFDDGCVYYPAPFESLAVAAKSGNPDRLISYNSYVGTKITEFQDMIFGEGGWAEESPYEPTLNGILQSGKEKGLLRIGMPMINNDNWGITQPDESIDLTVDVDEMIKKIKSTHARKVPMMINLKMWEGGIIGQSTYDALVKLKEAISF